MIVFVLRLCGFAQGERAAFAVVNAVGRRQDLHVLDAVVHEAANRLHVIPESDLLEVVRCAQVECDVLGGHIRFAVRQPHGAAWCGRMRRECRRCLGRLTDQGLNPGKVTGRARLLKHDEHGFRWLEMQCQAGHAVFDFIGRYVGQLPGFRVPQFRPPALDPERACHGLPAFIQVHHEIEVRLVRATMHIV